MQVFIPLVNFTGVSSGTFFQTAKCLDDRRLNKQIVEAKQIIDILEHRNVRSYQNHAVVTSWRGYEECLKVYLNTMLREWILSRGRQHSIKFQSIKPHDCPPWLGYQHIDILLSHRTTLYNKDPEHYKQFRDDLCVTPVLYPTTLYRTYYKILYNFEFMFGEPEDAEYYPERYETREEAVAQCQKTLLEWHGHYYIDGNSRFAIDNPVQLEPLFVRLQPIRFIDYEQPL